MSHKILIVDDEPSIRFVLKAVFEQKDYVVDLAEDGFAALRKIQIQMPDLVISDLRMPNMNGFELLSVLRTRFPNLPTIAISGEFLTHKVDGNLLADAFFQKGSYSVPELLAKAADLLSSPPKHTQKSQVSSVWAPTGDAQVMLTCTSCLRSFPIETCEGTSPAKQTDCIFCGVELDVRLVAIGTASSSVA
jgi:CheY-like chemotaxis protein